MVGPVSGLLNNSTGYYRTLDQGGSTVDGEKNRF